MLYNFNGTLINVADIVSVQSVRGQRAEYPFVLTVALRNGQQFSVFTDTNKEARCNRSKLPKTEKSFKKVCGCIEKSLEKVVHRNCTCVLTSVPQSLLPINAHRIRNLWCRILKNVPKWEYRVDFFNILFYNGNTSRWR